MAKAKNYFSLTDNAKIVAAIRRAEQKTSGEIKVRIENRTFIQVVGRARYLFFKLKVHLTKDRNGVLLYIAVKSKKFAIIGDIGIQKKVGNDFWNDVKAEMSKDLADGKVLEAIIDAVDMTGEKLKEHFPYDGDDKNEVEDEVSYGD